ncbi:nitrogen regulation protein NR(II) [Geobacillus sp. C56-T3]|uniref:two-component system sensor histidine kinase NtrB n=1 Tax=Geobacillus sp. (strain C56-T3) TaxID=691437 RepID=UPI0001D585DA|nr:ATP-binding protein [Geobacillus sp. C56-T3]ADI26906.1 signal transduction histidine kinase, nitrogen specific, NtrB [Geobacillus sp. C56-T3]
MNDRLVQSQIEELERKLRAYERLIEKLPFPFTFADYESGIAIEKKRGDVRPHLRTIPPSLEKEAKWQWDIDLYRDVPFEKVEAFLTPLLDLVPHHIVFVDAQGIITLCNLQAAVDTGVDRDAIIGKHIRELLKLPDELIATLESLEKGEPLYNYEVLDRFYGIVNTRFIYNDDGSIKRVISMFQSLNMMKETEKLAVAGRIAAGIAHEIRNPLTTVRGYLQLLKSDLPDRIASLVERLLIPELDRANDIITDFLNIAKPADVKMETFNLHRFLRDDVGVLLQSEALLHNVDVHFDLDDQLDDYEMNGDRSQLLQVFLNLFRNAVEAKVAKTMRVSICSRKINHLVQLRFCDDGPGIPPSVIDHVFDPFFSTKETGTGLGLSLSKKIVELHRGTMKVQSDAHGTCFLIEFPLCSQPPFLSS